MEDRFTILGTVTPSGYNYQVYSVTFAAPATGSLVLSFVGLAASGTAFIDAVAVRAASAAAANYGFEAPSVGSGPTTYAYAASDWATAGAGVTGNNSAFTGSQVAPQGSQVGFVQGAGTLEQTISGWKAGTYVLTFLAAQRQNVPGNHQTFQVKVDGAVVGSFDPQDPTGAFNYQAYATAPFVIAGDAHTIAFVGLSAGSDTAFLDDVDLRPASLAVTRWTLYDGSAPILDFDGSGAQTARYLQAGPDVVDQVLARETSFGVAWYLPDRLGTIRDLADNSGAIIDHVDYNAYGQASGETAPAVGDRMTGFAGLQRSAATGLNLAVHRVQDPNIGVWLSEDPISFAARDANLNRYVKNNVTNKIDPQGLDIWIQPHPVYGPGGVPTGQNHVTIIVWNPETSEGIAYDGDGPGFFGSCGTGGKRPLIPSRRILPPNSMTPGSDWTPVPTRGTSYQSQSEALDEAYWDLPQDQDYNAFFGPNSNTWACILLIRAGFPAPTPPGAPGWNWRPAPFPPIGPDRYGGALGSW